MKRSVLFGLALAVAAVASGATADWICPQKDAGDAASHPAFAVRKAFTNDAEIVRATWRVSGLGCFVAYVNGQRLRAADDGLDELLPGFTDARKRRQVFSYDVAALLDCRAEAVNVLSAEVSKSWWADRIVGPGERPCAFKGVLELGFADGSQRTVATDGDWQAAYAGPLVSAEIFAGEHYDARESVAWRTTGPLDVRWRPAAVTTAFAGVESPAIGPALRIRRDLVRRPVSVVGKGRSYLVDFGQNLSGWEHFTVRGRRGTVLRIRHAEMLNVADPEGRLGCDGPAGTPYYANLRGAPATTEYVLSGEGDESYRPSCTYYGFRYAALEASDDIELVSIEAEPVTAIAAESETFRIVTGDESVNRLIAAAEWTVRNNASSTFTDCPQREERLGWMGELQLSCAGVSQFAALGDYWRKIAQDIRDAQFANGAFSSVAPWAQYGNEPNKVGWASAGVTLPYVVWRMTGDRRIVEENLPAIARHLALQEKALGSDPRWGDWLSLEANCRDATYQKLLCRAFCRQDAARAAAMFRACGDEPSARKADDLAARALGAARRECLGADGLLRSPWRTQTMRCVALSMGLFDGDEPARRRTVSALVEDVRAKGGLRTGTIGTSLLLPVLCEADEVETAYSLALNRTMPSWLYMIDQGATTIWERWDGFTPETGFIPSATTRMSAGTIPVMMNSFDHPVFGVALLQWLYEYAAGIRLGTDGVGWARFALRPQPDRRLGSLSAEYRSPSGTIRSAWRYEGESWIWDFSVPDGTTAFVSVPGRKAKDYPAGTYRISVPSPARVVQPTDFGAVYDGVSDCADAIQKCLDLGGTIRFVGSGTGLGWGQVRRAKLG